MKIDVFNKAGEKIDSLDNVSVEDKGTHFLVTDLRKGYDLYIRSYHKTAFDVKVCE